MVAILQTKSVNGPGGAPRRFDRPRLLRVNYLTRTSACSARRPSSRKSRRTIDGQRRQADQARQDLQEVLRQATSQEEAQAGARMSARRPTGGSGGASPVGPNL